MPVNSTHPDYDKVKNKWDLVRSIVDNDAQKWIRTVDRNDLNRSKQYKNDAILTNFTRQTKTGLTGLVFRKPSIIELAPGLEYLNEDATGYGFGLDQFAQQIISEVLMTGRYGLLIDFPATDADRDGPDSDDFARFRPYTAENIINWRYEEFGSQYKPVLIVLKEDIHVVMDDPFVPVLQPQYRVLTLNPDGIYQQWLYDKDYEVVQGYPITPVDYSGNPMRAIPFVFIGSENNNSTMDNIPLYDLAVVNLGHYRNSADLEESIWICGQPTPVICVGESSAQEFELMNPNGVSLGARSGITLPMGGTAHLLQANPNLMVSEQMKEKVIQMAALGARMVQAVVGRETAEASRIRFGAQNSALFVLTKNISMAIEEGLEWIARFQLENPTSSQFELNSQFYEDSADATIIAQEIMMLDRGIMSVEEIRNNLRMTGVLPPVEGDEESPHPLDPLAGVEDPDFHGAVVDATSGGRDPSTGIMPNELA